MAMIQCKECGSNVSDAAPTCPSCGISSPGGSCTVTFVRTGLNGRLMGMEVYVDGKPCGGLGPTGRITVPVAPGPHQFEVLTSRGGSAASTVTASNGEVVVNVSLGMTNKPKFG